MAAVGGISQGAKGLAQRKCENCGETDKKLQRCSKCRVALYCGRGCQVAAWPKHKKVCPVKKKSDQGNSTDYINSLFGQFAQINYVSSTPPQTLNLTETQLEDANALVQMTDDIDAILDEGEVEAAVKQRGQELFDKYKGLGGMDSHAAKRAVRNICDWIAFNPRESKGDARKRKAHIEAAWDGIGDENWTWRR